MIEKSKTNSYNKTIIVPEYQYPGLIIGEIDKKYLKGAKVTLINAPIREQAQPNVAPLGPALLASRLREYDVDVTIVDLNIYRIFDDLSKQRKLTNGRALNFVEAEQLLNDTFNKIGDQDLIGISGLITTLSWQEKIVKIVRKLQQHTIIASGGGLATEFRELLFQWLPELNAVAHSEGDDVILKMAYDAKLIRKTGMRSAIASGKLKPYFIDELNGRARFYYDGGRPKNLDSLPFPAWDLLETDINGFPVLEEYLNTPVWGDAAQNSSATPFQMSRSLNMISSRGCPFACRFCFRGAQGERNYGIRSAQNVIEEMVLNRDKYNVDFVGIVDDNFMVDPKRIIKLEEIIRPFLLEKNITWGTHGRLDEAADLRPSRKNGGASVLNSILRVEKMAEAGCVYIGFGAESASHHVLEEMGKGGFMLTNGMTRQNGFYFPKSMVEGVRNTKKSGIHANCTWIMGYPGERLEDLKTTVAFIKWQEELYTQGLTLGTLEYEINRNSVNRSLFVAQAYPGTEMFKLPIVREKLNKIFGLSFNSLTKEVIPDENLYLYVKELEDATKVLKNEAGQLYYGSMNIDEFLQAKEFVEKKELYKILDM